MSVAEKHMDCLSVYPEHWLANKPPTYCGCRYGVKHAINIIQEVLRLWWLWLMTTCHYEQTGLKLLFQGTNRQTRLWHAQKNTSSSWGGTLSVPTISDYQPFRIACFLCILYPLIVSPEYHRCQCTLLLWVLIECDSTSLQIQLTSVRKDGSCSQAEDLL